MTYEIFKDKAGEWRWHLKAFNYQIIAVSGEGYKNKADCLEGIKLVKNSASAPVKNCV